MEHVPCLVFSIFRHFYNGLTYRLCNAACVLICESICDTKEFPLLFKVLVYPSLFALSEEMLLCSCHWRVLAFSRALYKWNSVLYTSFMDGGGRSSLTHSEEWFWDRSPNPTHYIQTTRTHRLHTHTRHTHTWTYTHTRLHTHITYRYAHRLHTHTTYTHYTQIHAHTDYIHTPHTYMYTQYIHAVHQQCDYYLSYSILFAISSSAPGSFFSSEWFFRLCKKFVWVTYFHFLWVNCKELSLVALWKFCKAPWRAQPLVRW